LFVANALAYYTAMQQKKSFVFSNPNLFSISALWGEIVLMIFQSKMVAGAALAKFTYDRLTTSL
jgi:hypothetical protein